MELYLESQLPRSEYLPVSWPFLTGGSRDASSFWNVFGTSARVVLRRLEEKEPKVLGVVLGLLPGFGILKIFLAGACWAFLDAAGVDFGMDVVEWTGVACDADCAPWPALARLGRLGLVGARA